MKHKLARLFYNLKQYGIIRTIKKIFVRIFNLDKKNVKSEEEIYKEWILNNEPDDVELRKQSEKQFVYHPKISIVVPMYNSSEKYFLELLNSVLGQTYSNWELCLADGSGVKNENIEACVVGNPKIKYEFLKENYGISGNTNKALKMATGDYIAFLDHDDTLSPFALYEIVSQLNENMNTDFIYSDEDKIDEEGNRYNPYFKPDFSPEMIEVTNYITHFVVVKRDLYEKIGNLNKEFDGAQDFDFVLRATENAQNIVHISKILYHWRAHKNSTAYVTDSKSYAFEIGTKVVEKHLERTGKEGKVINPGEVPGVYRINYKLKGNPKVSILIPSCDNVKLLKNCIKSILNISTYDNYEILILENNSKEAKTFNYYKKIQKNDKVRVVDTHIHEFNYSKIINYGVESCSGEYVLQLNNDTKIITPDWLETLIGYAQNKEIGAVGARLLYSDKSIQHGGIAIGIGDLAGNLLVNLPYGTHGYYCMEAITRNVSSVTGACLFARKSIYKEVGFMNEEFAVAFNDVDFCLRILEKGYRIVYNPYVEIIHYESKTRGYEDTPEKQQRFNDESEKFKSIWKNQLEVGDKYYNRNFSRNNCNFQI